MRLSSEEKRTLQSVFRTRPDSPCDDCGGYHLRKCPRIKRIVCLGNGNRTEVEYWPEWDDSFVAYPEDVFDDEEDK